MGAPTQTGTSTSPWSADQAVLLYDRDCGLCRTVLGGILALDRRRRLRPVALQSPEAVELLPGLTEEERMASFHLVEGNRVHSAGEALSRLMSYLPAGAPVGARMGRAPGPTERAYRLIADNRSRIGPLIPDAVKRRATTLIDARS